MSVLRDSHRGIVTATVVYDYISNAICSHFHEFLSTGNQSADHVKPQ